MATFHERLKELRDTSGQSQAQIAESLEIAPQNLSYYFNGREPNYELLIKIAKLFNVTTDYLLGLSDIRNPKVTDDLYLSLLGHYNNAATYTQLFKDMHKLQVYFDNEHKMVNEIKADTEDASREELDSLFYEVSHKTREMLDEITSQIKSLYDEELKSIRKVIDDKQWERGKWEEGQYRMDADRP